MTRIVVAGAGAVGASVALHLARRGARGVVLAERSSVAGGATGRAMGGVRQQFSTAPEVRLAQRSAAFFRSLGPGLFSPVGYLFLATDEEGAAALGARVATQQALGVPVHALDAAGAARLAPGVAVDDVLAAAFCGEDGTADPAAVTRELVRQAAALGVDVREGVDASSLPADVLVIACGADSPALAARHGVTLPIEPLVRQLLETTPVAGLPATLPLTVESGSGFHFRRRGGRLVLAMTDPAPRWSREAVVDESVYGDRLARLARRYPPARDAAIEHGWAGLYDMTPDAHPILGPIADGVYAACGFSGHGFMQAPAAGDALAQLILEGGSELDLQPYRLDRFAAGERVPEHLIL